jgi:hypothetical protein
LGRFISEDPVGFKGGVNWFAYVGNNPLGFRDPMGLWPSGHIVPLSTHQNSMGRVLDGRVSPTELLILQQEQYNWDGESQDVAYAYAHALRVPGQSIEEARQRANAWVRANITTARNLAANGYRNQAMFYLSRAIHTVQDATSPSHAGFNEAWEDTTLQTFNHIPHYLAEAFDPGPCSILDKATESAYKYFTGELEMPDDFFGNSYDSAVGPLPLRHGSQNDSDTKIIYLN